jgi:hypothetical protein
MSKARNLSAFISEAAIDASEIGSNAVTTDKILDSAVTHTKLHTDMDLTGKTVTFADNHISGNKIHGGVISDFASIGIDDNASSTAITIFNSGNVGVGSASDPLVKFQALQSANEQWAGDFKSTGVDAYGLRVDMSGSTGTKYALAAYTAAGTGLFLLNDGKLGIGTTTPDAKLDIEGNFESAYALKFTNTQGTGRVSGFRSHGVNGETFSLYHDGSRRQMWNSAGSVTFEGNSGNTQLYIENGGNIGIGTSTPDKALDVAVGNDNAIRIRNENGSNTNGLALAVGSGSPWMDITEGREFRIKHTPYANIGDWNNGSNARFVINGNGRIGIGTESPAAKLHVNGDGGYSWGNGTYTKLGTISRYDMGGYNSGASNVSRQLLYYAYDQANWNTQYLKVIVRHSYYYTGGEAAYILDCNNSSARQLYNNNAGVGGTPFTFSNNDISGNHRVTSVTFNPGITYHSYYFTFEWTDGFNASGQTSTPAVNGISFSH